MMKLVAEHKQISKSEKAQIDRQVKAELIDHLYQGCLPGTISGMLVSIVIFLDYFRYTNTVALIIWMIVFNLMMILFSGLYFLYMKYKSRLHLLTWERAYSVFMAGCALAWVPGVYLLPSNNTRQYIALLALFMATTGYATGTIGQFYLCVLTLHIILVPLIIWCLIQGGLFYNIIATFTIIYMAFMCGINLRSTKWFKESLKLKLENTLVSYQATHDFLTNLPNQRVLPQYVEAASQSVADSSQFFVLVCFSLNRMEFINDSIGHQAGNHLIQLVANRLNLLANEIEETQYIITISRKDTFNILITPLTHKNLFNSINKLFTVLDEPFYLEQRALKMTASIGVSVYPQDGTDTQNLLINADAAMLKAKKYGGNRLEFYRKEINAQIPSQVEMENDLHHAVINKELLVYYQPLIDLHTGLIAGSEALLRWPHPAHGFVSPMSFIPLAEETGLIIPIGNWILEEACIQTLKWHEMGYAGLKVAVNISGKQLYQENLVENISKILAKTGFNPKFLELELTETAILDEAVMGIIQELKQLGLSLAVDDFGTGYSGLSYLKRFSIDKLKIDQSFIRDIPGNNDSITIVSAILAMAKELSIQSLAEGVETEEQLYFLKSKGCDFIQGYYFSKPLEASFFTQLLQTYRNQPIFTGKEIS